MNLRILDVKQLIKYWGGEITLNNILEKLMKDKKYICPKCNASGQEKYNAYPMGLPDSGCVYKEGLTSCSLCGGDGYTSKLYKPKYELTGYEKTGD